MPRNVFLIVMENHSPDEALSGPFTASLAARYGVAANYHAITHPSVPNYLALTSGQTWGVRDDGYYELPAADIGHQLSSAGVTWRAYMEGLGPAGCLDSPPPYEVRHNPFAYYGVQCPSNVVPPTNLHSDLASGASRFSWITPDTCHDTHGCSVSVGDQWLRRQVGAIMQSRAWSSNGLLFVTWDEDDYSADDNRVLTLVIAPAMKHKVSYQSYTHYSLLATIENLMGVGRLAQAAHAQPMADLLKA
jgi:hypothetical protein